MTEPRLPMPELIQRADRPPAAWRVLPGRAQRGQAWTNLGDGLMRAPAGDDPTSRCIRAHELMHAKVSPFVRWLPDDCSHLTLGDVDAAEEFRVNMLVRAAGFPVKVALYDRSEGQVGSALAAAGDWNGLVRMMAATAGTRAATLLLAGVYRRDRDMHRRLRLFAVKLDRLWRSWTESTDENGQKSIDLSRVASTAPWNDTVAGWEFTLEVAYLLHDHLQRPSDDDGDLPSRRFCHGIVEGPPAGAPTDTSTDESTHATTHIDPIELRLAEAPRDPVTGAPLFDGSRVLPGRATPVDRPGRGRRDDEEGFAELVERKLVLDLTVEGALGRRKRPAPSGIHPRRIHRLLVDPERRVFEAKARGRGGVVLIDQSGSMSLDSDDIERLLRAAPGCTVIGYSHLAGSTDVPNIWVIAHRGRVASTVPLGNTGNGVDGPAIEFAAARRRADEPFVWVCDGRVTNRRDSATDEVFEICAELVQRHRIHMVADVDDADAALRRAARGERLPTRAVGLLEPLVTPLPY